MMALGVHSGPKRRLGYLSGASASVGRDMLVERLFGAAVATFDLYAVHLGDRSVFTARSTSMVR